VIGHKSLGNYAAKKHFVQFVDSVIVSGWVPPKMSTAFNRTSITHPFNDAEVVIPKIALYNEAGRHDCNKTFSKRSELFNVEIKSADDGHKALMVREERVPEIEMREDRLERRSQRRSASKQSDCTKIGMKHLLWAELTSKCFGCPPLTNYFDVISALYGNLLTIYNRHNFTVMIYPLKMCEVRVIESEQLDAFVGKKLKKFPLKVRKPDFIEKEAAIDSEDDNTDDDTQHGKRSPKRSRDKEIRRDIREIKQDDDSEEEVNNLLISIFESRRCLKRRLCKRCESILTRWS